MIREVLKLYAGEALTIRLFVKIRHLLCPLERIEMLVPREGKVLDVGCGHGLFTMLMALHAPARLVWGVDPSSAKIQVAKRAAASLPNVRYQVGYAEDVQGRGFDAITIIDVLYLLPPEKKEALLRRCAQLLRKGGRLILKTNDTQPQWKYLIAYGQEKLMTTLGLTMGQGGLYFYSADENRRLLEKVGFGVRVTDLNSHLPYPHIAFCGEKI